MIAKFRKLGLFLTAMCNSKCREISENVHDSEIPINCPDSLARVFNEVAIGRHHCTSCTWQSGS